MKHTGIIKLALLKMNNTESVVHIKDSSIPKKGRPSNCYCLQCGEPLIPKRGKILDNSFAHQKDSSCSNETILHKAAKHVFLETKEILLPGYLVKDEINERYRGKNILEKFEKWGDVNTHTPTTFSKVELEKKFLIDESGPIIADAVAYKGNDIYCLVEFVVTHAIDEIKYKKLTKLNIPVLEINLLHGLPLVSNAENFEWDVSDIHKYLVLERRSIQNDDGKKWTFHPGRRALKNQIGTEKEITLRIRKEEIDIIIKNEDDERLARLSQEEKDRLEARKARELEQEKIRAEYNERRKQEEEERQKIAQERLAKEQKERELQEIERLKKQAMDDARKKAKLQKDEQERIDREEKNQKILKESTDKEWLKNRIKQTCEQMGAMSVTRHGYKFNFPTPGTFPYRLEIRPFLTQNPANMRRALDEMEGPAKRKVTLGNPSESREGYSGKNPFHITIEETDREKAVLNLVEAHRRDMKKRIHDSEISKVIANYPFNPIIPEEDFLSKPILG